MLSNLPLPWVFHISTRLLMQIGTMEEPFHTLLFLQKMNSLRIATTRKYLTHYLFSLRKDFKFTQEHKWYVGLDGGLNHHVQRTKKNSLETEVHNTGYTTGLVLGTDWTVSQKVSFAIEATYTRSYTGTINYNDQFSSSSLKYYGLDLGLSFF